MCGDWATLPGHLLEALQESTDSYNSEAAERSRGEANKRRAQNMEDEKKAKLKAEKAGRAAVNAGAPVQRRRAPWRRAP